MQVPTGRQVVSAFSFTQMISSTSLSSLSPGAISSPTMPSSAATPISWQVLRMPSSVIVRPIPAERKLKRISGVEAGRPFRLADAGELRQLSRGDGARAHHDL